MLNIGTKIQTNLSSKQFFSAVGRRVIVVETLYRKRSTWHGIGDGTPAKEQSHLFYLKKMHVELIVVPSSLLLLQAF